MVFAIAASSLAAWVYLALFHDHFWRADQRLDEPSDDIADWPGVVAVIPARNEAATISAATTAHIDADYPGAFQIIVVDDGSDDGTATLAASAAPPGRRRLTVIAAPPLPPGWSGKLNAVKAGTDAAEKTAPGARYLLLSDADIVLAPSTLRALVAKAEADDLALVSLMARLDHRGFWAGLLAPAFVYFFQKLYPFPAVNDPRRRMAGAAGGCMLVRRDALAAAGGIAAISGRLIDDCALADLIKNGGREGRAPRRPIWLGLADDEAVSLRDNRPLASFWSMVERTAFTQLRRSWLRLVGCIIGMLLLYAAPPLLSLGGLFGVKPVAVVMAMAAWVIMAATFRPTARLYHLSTAHAFALPLAGVLYTAMTLSSAINDARGIGGRWKGRTFPAPP